MSSPRPETRDQASVRLVPLVRAWALALPIALAAFPGALAAEPGPHAGAWRGKPGIYAVMTTSEGSMVFELYPREAPKTVENFVGLAEGTKEFTDPTSKQKTKRRFYDGT